MAKGAQKRFLTDASDSVWLWSRKTSVPFKGMATGRRIRFTESDLHALRRMKEVQYAAGENPLGTVWGGSILVTHGKSYGNFGVFGVSDDYFKIKVGQDYRLGRKINDFDENETRKIAVIGTLVADRLFKQANPIGQYIEINKIPFRVVGLFYDPQRNGQSSERIYIPLSVYQPTFGGGKQNIQTMVYTPKPEYDPMDVEQKVLALFRQRHTVSPEDRSAIRSYNYVPEVRRATALKQAIDAFIWFVGIGTLAAGVVGISNIMMITVKERTAEIGVRKAMGARPGNIVFSLLFESVLVTAIAGYLGLVFGVALIELISMTMQSLNIQSEDFDRPEIDFTVALTAMGILIFVGLLAGFAPAWKAAKISPVEAMRAE